MLRFAGLLLFPILVQAGSLTFNLSVTCGSTTLTSSSDIRLSCQTPVGPGGVFSFADADAAFGAGFAGIFADADGNCGTGVCTDTSAHAEIDASYQMTVSGSSGPGYIEPELCSDPRGHSNASLDTPNGSIEAFSTCRFADIPILFGVPLDVQLTIVGGSSLINNRGTDGVQATMMILRVLDAQMNPVAATISVAIPEPPTAPLLIVALGLLLLRPRPSSCAPNPISLPDLLTP